jgi:hypothetical protein
MLEVSKTVRVRGVSLKLLECLESLWNCWVRAATTDTDREAEAAEEKSRSADTITREIRQASSPTMRGHFGCIFKDTEGHSTEVWWAFYMRIIDT